MKSLLDFFSKDPVPPVNNTALSTNINDPLVHQDMTVLSNLDSESMNILEQ